MKNTVATVIFFMLLSGGMNCLEAKKSTALALGISIGVPTLGCWAGWQLESAPLFLIALAVGPSAGHCYAKQIKQAAIFTGFRAAIILGAIGILAEARRTEPEGANWAVLPVGAAAVGICGIITLVDWISVPSSVRRYNESLQIKPEIDLKNNRYGVSVIYRF